MTTITVAIQADDLVKLNEIAARLQVTPEELVRVSIQEILARPEDAFEQASGYVLQKNKELYRRLA